MEAQFLRERESQVMKFVTGLPRNANSDFPKDEIADIENTYSGTAPYHVNYCGFEDCYPGYQFGPHTRTSHLLHVVFSGKGSYHIRSYDYEVSSGQIFYIPPGVQTVYRADDETPWSYGWVGFSGYHSEVLLSQMGFTDDRYVISLDNTEPLHGYIDKIMQTHKLTYSNELYRTAELLNFFAYAIEHTQVRHIHTLNYSKSEYARIAVRYLDSNYMHRIKIAELADYIGIDRSYLTKIFCEEYHLSPQEYLIRLRLEKAEQMLKNSSLPITQVAFHVGYEDPLAFSKMFKQRRSISPTEYRKIYHDDIISTKNG